MIYYADGPYLECPDCGTQIWPFAMEKTDHNFIRQEFEKNLQCARDKRVGDVKIHVKSQVKGGSKSKKARNKQAMQKPSQVQIYNKLVVEPSINYNKELSKKVEKGIAN